jgi:hypothetical protein
MGIFRLVNFCFPVIHVVSHNRDSSVFAQVKLCTVQHEHVVRFSQVARNFCQALVWGPRSVFGCHDLGRRMKVTTHHTLTSFRFILTSVLHVHITG